MKENSAINFWKHPTAEVAQDAKVGQGTKIWHQSQVQRGASIGENCVLGHNCFVASGAKIGNGVKLESNIDIWDKVVLEDHVFVGPSAVFTNDKNPRAKYPKSQYPQYGQWEETVIREGATIGANATIVCGNTVGKWAFVAAGAVVTKDVQDYAVVAGVPARVIGWICECGVKLDFEKDRVQCLACQRQYQKTEDKVIPQ